MADGNVKVIFDPPLKGWGGTLPGVFKPRRFHAMLCHRILLHFLFQNFFGKMIDVLIDFLVDSSSSSPLRSTSVYLNW